MARRLLEQDNLKTRQTESVPKKSSQQYAAVLNNQRNTHMD
ncbi:hypothetical protein [Staphylococcus ureilyticus]|nr:hypothetical protein [Staphylococcus ureilyticus]